MELSYHRSLDSWGTGFQPSIRCGGGSIPGKDGPDLMRNATGCIWSVGNGCGGAGLFEGTAYLTHARWKYHVMNILNCNGHSVASFRRSGTVWENFETTFLDQKNFMVDAMRQIIKTEDTAGNEAVDPSCAQNDIRIANVTGIVRRSAANAATGTGDLVMVSLEHTEPVVGDVLVSNYILHTPPHSAGNGRPTRMRP